MKNRSPQCHLFLLAGHFGFEATSWGFKQKVIWWKLFYPLKKSRIRETPTLLSDANSRTNTNFKRLRDWSKFNSHQLGPLGRVGQRVDMSVCVFVWCPLPMRFFSRPFIGPQIGPQQSAFSKSSVHLQFNDENMCSKASRRSRRAPSICNLMMKTCVAKPVGVREELRPSAI